MDVIKKYFDTFLKLPPILTTVSQYNKTYIKLVESAIAAKKPLYGDELERAFKDKYDLVDDFDKEDDDGITD